MLNRLTHERSNGIKTGYWSPAKKDELIERLAAYKDTGLEPQEIYGLKAHRILEQFDTDMDHIVDQMMQHICDNLCREPIRVGRSQEELDHICAECKIGDFRKRILNTYDPEMIPRWIPVSESLPDTEEFVLIIVSGKPRKNITLEHAVELAVYDPNEGWILEMYPEWCEAEVVAWMPTPEPYKVG